MAAKRIPSKKKSARSMHAKPHKTRKHSVSSKSVAKAKHASSHARHATKQPKRAQAKGADAPISPKASARLLRNYLANASFSEFLQNLAGENASKVLTTMEGAMSDEEIARGAKLKVSDVRSVLNKLHGQGIATYERTRDKDTGWYYYKWSINHGAVQGAAGSARSKGPADATVEGAGNIYACGTCAQEKYPFETALDYLFKCPQCGSSLDYADAKQSKK